MMIVSSQKKLFKIMSFCDTKMAVYIIKILRMVAALDVQFHNATLMVIYKALETNLLANTYFAKCEKFEVTFEIARHVLIIFDMFMFIINTTVTVIFLATPCMNLSSGENLSSNFIIFNFLNLNFLNVLPVTVHVNTF